jgi:hypothetical protein
MVKDLRTAAVVSLILVLPLVLLEFRVNGLTGNPATGYLLLFGVLWLLPTMFVVILLPVWRAIRAGKFRNKAANVILRLACLGVIATLWGGLFIDQLPCFLGIPNCD